jgi:hypothetical protein
MNLNYLLHPFGVVLNGFELPNFFALDKPSECMDGKVKNKPPKEGGFLGFVDR